MLFYYNYLVKAFPVLSVFPLLCFLNLWLSTSVLPCLCKSTVDTVDTVDSFICFTEAIVVLLQPCQQWLEENHYDKDFSHYLLCVCICVCLHTVVFMFICFIYMGLCYLCLLKQAQIFITFILLYVRNGMTLLSHASLANKSKSVFKLYLFNFSLFFSLSRSLWSLDLSSNIHWVFLVLVEIAYLINVLSVPLSRIIMKILNRTRPTNRPLCL